MESTMHRRHLLIAFPVWLTASAQNLDLPLASPVDAVNFNIIPTDGISEEAAGGIARALTKETGLWIKSTLWMPPDGMEPGVSCGLGTSRFRGFGVSATGLGRDPPTSSGAWRRALA